MLTYSNKYSTIHSLYTSLWQLSLEYSMKEHQLRTPIPFSEIGTFALQSAEQARAQSKLYAQAARAGWNDFSSTCTQVNDRWCTPLGAFTRFSTSVSDASKLIGYDDNSIKLAHMMETLEGIKDDYITLGAFLIHDMHHIRPIEAFAHLLTIENTHLHTSDKQTVWMFDRHKHLLQELIDRGEELGDLMTLPFEFVHGIAALETNEQLPVRRFHPYDILDIISLHIQGRFASDDYRVARNTTTDKTTPSNWIIVNAPEDLTVETNKAMLFSVIYNLVKNAAKANSELHGAQKNKALYNLYHNNEPLKTPRNLTLSLKETDDSLIFSIGDEGLGLSLDDSLTRAQVNLARTIQQFGAENVPETEWYRNIRRILGHQAEYLIAWPTDPFALRRLKIGSLFDLQFCAGFEGDTWKLRTFTSGTGLWGVRYLTERLGGTVMGTNKFEGGAYFSVAIPKNNLNVGVISKPS